MQVFHGNIITCNEKNTVNKYLVEKEGRIAFVGDVLPDKYTSVPPIELDRGALLPSFVDTHCHYAGFSMVNKLFPIREAESNARILEQISRIVYEGKENIIIAYGASDFAVTEGHMILKEQLDAVCPDKPCMVVTYDAHSCIVNSQFLAQIKERCEGLRGYREESGELTQEAFMVAMETASKGMSTRRVIDAMMESCDFMASQGVGMVHSATGAGFYKDKDFDMEYSVATGIDNRFQMRIGLQTEDLNTIGKRTVSRIIYSNLDGTLGSRDAALKDNYLGEISNKGINFHNDDELYDFCRKANRAGLQIALHAVGDAAFEQAAHALAYALEDYPRYDHRHMILHAFLPTEVGLEICAQYGIILSMQPSIMTWPSSNKDYLISILGEDRTAKINPFKTCLEKGVKVCFNSDAPAAAPNPMKWIYNACNPYNPDEAISVQDAIRMCTINGAYSSFDDRDRGTLEIGKIADLVVLDANPLDVPVEELDQIKVQQLYLEGKPYQHPRTGAMATMLRGMFPQSTMMLMF